MKKGSSEHQEYLARIREDESLYYKVFNTPDGKRVLEKLEEMFYEGTSIVPNDPYATLAREGAREVIIHIKRTMKGVENNVD